MTVSSVDIGHGQHCVGQYGSSNFSDIGVCLSQ